MHFYIELFERFIKAKQLKIIISIILQYKLFVIKFYIYFTLLIIEKKIG